MKRNENKIQKVEDNLEMSKKVKNVKNVKLLKVATFGSSEKMPVLPKRGRGRPRKENIMTQDVIMNFKDLIDYISLKTNEGFINIQTSKLGNLVNLDKIKEDQSIKQVYSLELYRLKVTDLVVINKNLSTQSVTSILEEYDLSDLLSIFVEEDDDISIQDPKDLDTLKELLKKIDLSLKALTSVKSKGYVNNKEVPLLDEFIERMGLNKLLNEKGETYYLRHYTIQFYNWVFNLLLVNFYYVVTKGLKIYNEADDFRIDLVNLSNDLYNKLHPLIRYKLQKPGISVTLSTVVGFDTEFELDKIKHNQNNLLSVQIALNTRVIIRMPEVTPFEIGSINTLTSEIYGVEPNKSYVKINKNIGNVVGKIRDMEYEPYTKYIEKVKSLLMVQEMKSFEVLEKHCVYYIFPLSETSSKILYKDSYSFKELVDEVDEMVKPFNVNNIKIVSDLLLLGKLEDKKVERILSQSLSRISKREGGCLTTITFTKKTYICCHLTNADLSILKDFEVFKHELDIVHKNFITLGRPLRYGLSNVYIRDTSLLAPAGKKSLDAIGGIYGEEYKKVVIP